MPPAPQTPDRHSLWLLTLSPAIWMLHLLLCYGTAAVWCSKFAPENGTLNGIPSVIAWYTGLALAALAAIGWEGYRRHRYVPAEAAAHGGGTEATTHDLDTPEDRHRFLGFATLLLSGLSAVGVTYAALASRYFETCR